MSHFPILKWLLTGPVLYKLHAGDCSLLWVHDCHDRAMPREWYLTALPPSSDLQSFCLLFYKVPELLERVVVVPDYPPSQSSTSSWTHLCPCAKEHHIWPWWQLTFPHRNGSGERHETFQPSQGFKFYVKIFDLFQVYVFVGNLVSFFSM